MNPFSTSVSTVLALLGVERALAVLNPIEQDGYIGRHEELGIGEGVHQEHLVVSGSTTCRLNIDGCIEDLFRSPEPLFDCLVVGKTDTVSVHRGLSVVLLSNAIPAIVTRLDCVRKSLNLLEDFARRAHRRRSDSTARTPSVATATTCAPGECNSRRCAISCENCGAEGRPISWPLRADPWGVLAALGR
jgi:hypothetical protein